MDHHKHIVQQCVDYAFDVLDPRIDTFEDRVLTAMIRSGNSMLALETDQADAHEERSR